MLRHIAAAAALTTLIGPASALDLPAHKPGLWEMKLMLGGAGAHSVTLQRCTDAATDTLITALASGWADESCAKHDMSRNGDTLVIDSTCKIGPTTASAHAEITGSFDSAYSLTVSTRQEGQGVGAAAVAGRRIAVDAKWLGPCPAGQKPGDIVLPGGLTMNVRNFKALLGLTPPSTER
jgi:hypothetical protein